MWSPYVSTYSFYKFIIFSNRMKLIYVRFHTKKQQITNSFVYFLRARASFTQNFPFTHRKCIHQEKVQNIITSRMYNSTKKTINQISLWNFREKIPTLSKTLICRAHYYLLITIVGQWNAYYYHNTVTHITHLCIVNYLIYYTRPLISAYMCRRACFYIRCECT